MAKKSSKSKIKKKASSGKQKQQEQKYEFDVALSFAGEDRPYVDKVAHYLLEMGYKPFYDQNETVTLWGKDLYEHLSKVYSKQARFTVVFISKNYSEKNWTNHERRSAQARAFTENQEYLLPARFDNTEIPGIHSTVGYVDLKKMRPIEFAEMIKQKLGPIRRKNFFPMEVDRLISFMNIKKKADKVRAMTASYSFFQIFSLLTEEERRILMVAAVNSCPDGPPDNVHIEIPYLERVLKQSSEEILAALARITSLGFEFELKKVKKKKNEIGHANQILKIKFFDQFDYENISDIFHGVAHCFDAFLCPNCFINNINENNFSILSSVSGYPDKK